MIRPLRWMIQMNYNILSFLSMCDRSVTRIQRFHKIFQLTLGPDREGNSGLQTYPRLLTPPNSRQLMSDGVYWSFFKTCHCCIPMLEQMSCYEIWFPQTEKVDFLEDGNFQNRTKMYYCGNHFSKMKHFCSVLEIDSFDRAKIKD